MHLTSAQGPIPLKNIQLNGDTLSYEFTAGEFDVACALTRQDDGSYTGRRSGWAAPWRCSTCPATRSVSQRTPDSSTSPLQAIGSC